MALEASARGGRDDAARGGTRSRGAIGLLVCLLAAIGLLIGGAPGAGAAPTDLVTSITPGPVRNDFSGWVGMRIQGGASDLSVTALGRWVISGNSQSHAVRLVQASTGTDVATATVDTSGQPAGAFAFTTLGAPVTLLANTTYYLLSQESAGGDQWYDYTTTTVTTSAASDTGAVWATNATPAAFNVGGSAGQSYGVPNLRYDTVNAAPAITQHPQNQTITAGETAVFTAAASGVPTPTVQWESKAPAAGSFSPIGGAISTVLTVPSTTVGMTGTEYRAVFSNSSGPAATTNAATLTVNASPPAEGTAFVTHFTTSPLRNDFSGWVGMRIQGGASDLSVKALGRWVVSGNSQNHTVRLVNAATGTEVATAVVATSGQPAGAFAFTALGSPVTLFANTTYYLLSEEFAGGDTWYDYSTSTITTSVASDTGVVWATAGAPNAFNPGGAANQSFGVPNFRYTSVNAGPVVTQHPANQTVTAGGTAVFTAAASGVPTPTVQWESKPPAGSFSPIGGATSTVLTVPATTVGMTGTEYRAVFSNSSGPSATTNAATLTVNASPPLSGTPFVSYFTPSPLRNDFSGWVGMQFQVGDTNISVSSLGRWVVSGNSQAHTVRVVRVDGGTQVATASVATSGQPAGAFTYTNLGAPVTLLANTNYYILSEEFSGGDTWYDYNVATVTNPGATDTGSVWATAGSPNSFFPGGSNGQSYGVPNFTFSILNSAPTDIALTATSVAENQPSGTTVGTLSTTDADAGDTHTYSLVPGTGDADNASFTIDGNALKTAASFNFEVKSSYSVRIRTTDDNAGNLTFEKQFTITVTNVNDAPTDIALTSTSVAENSAINTVVGTLSATDQDAGQTYTFTLVGGVGSTDNASFNILGTSLRTSAPFNFEVKDTYSIRVQVTDNGTPNLNFEEQFTISVTDVNDAPAAVADSYSGAVGNTLFVLNSGGTGPKRVVTGSVITANDTDEDVTFPHTLSAVAETVSSTGGGSATITADGNFTFIPGVGDISQNDTFNYKVTDGSLQTTGTVTVAIGADRVWYADNSLGVNGDGRSTSPFNTLASLQGADPDAAGDTIFLYQGSGSYAGGLVLEANQRLIGQPEGLVVGGNTLLAAGGTNPTITNANAGGAGITLANGVTIRRVNVTGTNGAGITGTSITTADIGASTTITNSTGAAFDLTGNGTGNIDMRSNITHTSSGARSVSVQNRQGGIVAIAGAVDDTAGGIALATNTGATINFTGGMSVSSGANSAFSATGGGTVSVTGTNTLTNGAATALNVDGVTIGVSGLTFQSIASNGGVSGIVLNNTGSTGGLTVTGTGSPATAGSGGTIQNKSGAGISLTSVGGVVSLSGMATTGVSGADVLLNGGGANFTYTGTITNTGGRSVDVSNKTGGTVAFSNTINDTGGGISLTSNSGTTMNFTGALTLSTTTNAAFTATGGGTLNAGNAANTITTTTGTALNVNGTTIGASGLVFTSIAAGTGASGPASAIILNNTGTTAGLTVNGSGTTDGTGGHIQRTTGDAISLTNTRFTTLKNMIIGDSTATAGQTPNATNHIGGDGIDMNNADDVTLTNIRIARTGNHGIDGTGVTNLTLTNSEIYNAGDANGDSAFAFNDFGANQTNLEGTVTVTNSVFDGMVENGIDIENFGGTLNMTVSGSRFANNTSTLCSGGTCGENGLLARADGTSVINLTVNNNGLTKTIFDGIDGNGLFFISEGSSATASTLNVTQTTIQNSKAIGLVIFGGTGDHTSTIQSRLNFTVGGAAGSGVSITGSNATAVSIQPNGKSIVRGTFSHVTVNGSTVGRGIEVLADDVSTSVIDINNNTISNTAFNGIFANNGDSGVLDIHIRNNSVSAPLDTSPASGLAVHGIEVNPLAEASTTCLDIASNTSAGNAPSAGAGFRTRQRDPAVFKLERFTGSATSLTDVQNFLVAQNTSGTASATVNSGYTGVANGACADV